MRSLRAVRALRSSALLVVAAACGGAPPRAARPEKEFVCNGRRAEYMISGGMMYAEQGVRMKCDGEVPFVEEYFTNSDGTGKTRGARISAAAWEAAWRDIEGAGWRFVQPECKNPSASARDPIYTFEVADEDKTVNATCQGSELPFPYDTLVNALDKAKGSLPVEEGEP